MSVCGSSIFVLWRVFLCENAYVDNFGAYCQFQVNMTFLEFKAMFTCYTGAQIGEESCLPSQ